MHLSVFLGLISATALGLAYVSEHIFGLLPCVLCVYQRVPFFIVIVLSIISVFFQGGKKAVLIGLCGVSFIVGSGIAIFHVGVENGVFTMTEACEDTLSAETNSLEELRNNIIGKPQVPCDKPQFEILGISMAGMNFFFSGFLGIMTLFMVFKAWRLHKEENL